VPRFGFLPMTDFTPQSFSHVPSSHQTGRSTDTCQGSLVNLHFT
jgi:hypothetical protein